jgi:hypothetical protein
MILGSISPREDDSMDTAGDFMRVFTDESRRLHDQVRAEVKGLDPRALNWVPAGETNSVATLVVHILGSEAEVLRIVRAMPTDRDRDSEFGGLVGGDEELLGMIDEADKLLDQLTPHVSSNDLAAERIRPSAVRNKGPRKGIYWLLNCYGHTREHIGHLELTMQLYRSRSR